MAGLCVYINNNNVYNQITRSHDETDDSTNQTIFKIKTHRFTMNDSFHREDERLKTYENWPLSWMDKEMLSQTGMFYTGDEDKVKCYFCEVEIGRWEREDHPVSEHLRWSPNCPLLRRRTTNNVPINAEALEHTLPAISYDVCGANDSMQSAAMASYELRPHAYAEGTISPARMAAATSTAAPTNYFPEFPEYAVESARLRSFTEWPRHMKQKPEQLAEAGFFYTGTGDRVKCYSCGGGLKDWDEGDDPWEQHALWLRKCRFLNLMKGKMYIDGVVAKYQTVEEEKPATMAVPTPTPTPTTTIVATATTTTGSSTAAPAASSLFEDTLTSKPLTNSCSGPTKACDLLVSTTSCKLEKKTHSIPEEKLCKICYNDEYNTAFLPCGHVVACAKCASSVTKCPLCRKAFTDVMRVYFS